MSNICLNKTSFLLGTVIVILLIVFVNKYGINSHTTSAPAQVTEKKIIINKSEPIQKHIDNNNHHHPHKRPISRNEILYRRDQHALSNPLVAPTRRNPNYMYPPFTIPLNIPTRGYPDSYQYLGNLRRAADEKIVKLFGRQKYRGSNEYEFYGIMSDSNGSNIKIQIDQTKELYDGDEIDIDFLDTSKGQFKLYINKYDEPKYDPYLF